MAFNINIPQGRTNADAITDYDKDISHAEKARNNQKRDTDPAMQKDGCLYMDDIDRLRRKNLTKIY